MISKVKTMRSNLVVISWMQEELTVVLNENKPFGRQRMFGGYNGLEERFDELWQGFSENVTFEDVVNHFQLEKTRS